MHVAPPYALLYLEHLCTVRTYLGARLNCVETAAELAHETFVRLLARDPGDALHNPRALLLTIARNLAIDHYRARSQATLARLDDLDELACDKPGPERVAAARQELAHLLRAIDALPAQCRRVFVHVRFEGASHAEAAARFGISRNGVEKHLARALLRLHAALA